MMFDEEQDTTAPSSPLELVWRNPFARVRAHFRLREKNNPYCQWGKQARKIRARRLNWDEIRNWIE